MNIADFFIFVEISTELRSEKIVGQNQANTALEEERNLSEITPHPWRTMRLHASRWPQLKQELLRYDQTP